ncbi:MAG: metallophosphoesterase [Bacteroidetes bacterium]|nr:metallophosphoesterase [Bacteroidota bacterium]
MLSRIFSVSIAAFILIMIDLYVYQAIKIVIIDLNPLWTKIIVWTYWGVTLLTVASLYYYNFGNPYIFGRVSRTFLLAGIFINYFSKLFAVFFLFVDDSFRFVKWIASFFNAPGTTSLSEGGITRSEFLAKAAVISAAIPMATLGFGIVSGAHDYRLRRKTIRLPNLPKAFDGVTIGQLSDLHSGSFFNKKAVKRGIELLIREKPDIFFFTGDLVNNKVGEVDDFFDIYNKVSAPLGSFSIFGNHDYGDYTSWSSLQAKQENLKMLMEAHKLIGWDLLLDENRRIKIGNDEIAILGCQNWGTGRFAKYGDLKKTYAGSEDAPVKLLLSHDPSHWDAQIRPEYPDIDITFAGHTHGFQMGVEIGNFRWSPSQYLYKQWADLYREGNQYIYVNRGFGYIGYPGRLGILPEITIFELKSA